MQRLQRDQTTSPFVPDFMAQALKDVDFSELKKHGVRYIAFDADSTLVNFRGKVLSKQTKLFLQQQRKFVDGWCIASNRLTNDLIPLAESIDAQVIHANLTMRKPQRRFFDQVIRHFGAKPHEIVMIGDKLLADIWGAKRAGLVTVWVEKIGKDNFWDRLFQIRKLEEKMMNKFRSQK